MKEYVLKQKQDIVNEIKEAYENSQSVVLVEYRGLDVAEITELRSNYRNANVNYKVYKNTMMKIAFEELGLEEFNEYLTGPNAVAFSTEDAVVGAKVTNDFAKDHENLVIKAGIVDGKVIGVDEVKALASLPSKEVLIAQVLGTLNAPISGFANVLQGTIRQAVYAFNAVKEKKEQEEVA